MALPKLETLTYELNLPSTDETVKYRPFLVKEQKHLMIAQESEDTKLIENAFANIISDCTNECTCLIQINLKLIRNNSHNTNLFRYSLQPSMPCNI